MLLEVQDKMDELKKKLADTLEEEAKSREKLDEVRIPLSSSCGCIQYVLYTYISTFVYHLCG